jgi:hypothetical protein
MVPCRIAVSGGTRRQARVLAAGTYLVRVHRRVAIVALANKLARIIWAVDNHRYATAA